MIVLQVASGPLRDWCVQMLREHHYLRSPPNVRSRPLCYAAMVDGETAGTLTFGRTQSTCCYDGELTYGSQQDVAAGRAAYDRWEVLSLSRLWISPECQPGGRLHEQCPGFRDRKGTWRSTLATHLIGQALEWIGLDYLLAHPPCFIDQPYAIRAVLSYCDTHKHRGTVYRAAGWRLSRTSAEGIQTWWTPNVPPLSGEQDARVRQAASESPRSWRIRNAGRSLFDGLEAR